MSEQAHEKLDVDKERLSKLLPDSYTHMDNILVLAEKYTSEECKLDPVKGRAMVAELATNIEAARPHIVKELLAKLREPFSTIKPDVVPPDIGILFSLKKDLYAAFKFPSVIYNPEPEGALKDLNEDPWWEIKDQLIRCIKLSLLLELLNDPIFRRIAQNAVDLYGATRQENPIARHISRVEQDDYATVYEYQEFRRRAQGLKPFNFALPSLPSASSTTIASRVPFPRYTPPVIFGILEPIIGLPVYRP